MPIFYYSGAGGDGGAVIRVERLHRNNELCVLAGNAHMMWADHPIVTFVGYFPKLLRMNPYQCRSITYLVVDMGHIPYEESLMDGTLQGSTGNNVVLRIS